MEKIGFVLWETVTLLFVVVTGLGFLVFRRKMSGRPIFTRNDWLMYFGDLQPQLSKPKLALRLCLAALICFLLILAAYPFLGNLGPGISAVTFTFASFAIVKAVLR